MTQPDWLIWAVIVVLGAGTFALRFGFLGLVGDRPLPGWLLRALRYTPVAVLPGLVAPLVLWPRATGGEPDPARLAAALAVLAIGAATRNMLAGVMAGVVVLAGMMWLVG